MRYLYFLSVLLCIIPGTVSQAGVFTVPFIGPTYSNVDLEDSNTLVLEGVEGNLNMIFIPQGSQNIFQFFSIGIVGGVQNGKDKVSDTKYENTYQELEVSWGPFVYGQGSRKTAYKTLDNEAVTVDSTQTTLSVILGWPSVYYREYTYEDETTALGFTEEYGIMIKVPLYYLLGATSF